MLFLQEASSGAGGPEGLVGWTVALAPSTLILVLTIVIAAAGNESKRPTFEVTLEQPVAPLRLNRPAELAGKAQYYFGLPVVEGEISWQVERVPVYPRWWWYWGHQPTGPQIVATGAGITDPDVITLFTELRDEETAS